MTANSHHQYSAQGKNKMQSEFKKFFFKDVKETKLRIENNTNIPAKCLLF